MSGAGAQLESVDPPARYAALIAPVIERLTFAVVQRAISRGTDLPDRYQTTPDAIRMFGQLRTALAGRAVSPAALAAVYRYHLPEDLGRNARHDRLGHHRR